MDQDTARRLQDVVAAELSNKYGADESTMAEYIVVMLQNGKDKNGITAELSDLISDYDATFTDWIFKQAMMAQNGHSVSKSQENPMSEAMDTDERPVTATSAPTTDTAHENGATKGQRQNRMQAKSERGNPYAASAPNGPRAHQTTGPIRTAKGKRQTQTSNFNGIPPMPQIPGFPSPAEFFNSLPLADRLGGRPPSRRCSKWPNCYKGQACTFGHPTSICQNPQCRRKDGTCVSIHEDEDIDLKSGMDAQHQTEEKVAAQAIAKLSRQQAKPGNTRSSTSEPSPICKFGEACTNRTCHFSHPSPASKNGSSIVLNSEFCTADTNCQDENCAYSHSSPSNKFTPGVKLNGAASLASQCKFYPCLNTTCRFLHDHGQKQAKPAPSYGMARNKVWTPQTAASTTAERAFVAEGEPVEQFTADSNVHANDQEMEK